MKEFRFRSHVDEVQPNLDTHVDSYMAEVQSYETSKANKERLVGNIADFKDDVADVLGSIAEFAHTHRDERYGGAPRRKFPAGNVYSKYLYGDPETISSGRITYYVKSDGEGANDYIPLSYTQSYPLKGPALLTYSLQNNELTKINIAHNVRNTTFQFDHPDYPVTTKLKGLIFNEAVSIANYDPQKDMFTEVRRRGGVLFLPEQQFASRDYHHKVHHYLGITVAGVNNNTALKFKRG